MNDELADAESAPGNVVVTAALRKLEGLDEAPLEQHAPIFEDVRADLRSALDAD